jgi:transcriptional regulator with XRE-family HTH domain
MPRPLALEKTLMTQEEVASRLGISRSRVGQLETSMPIRFVPIR